MSTNKRDRLASEGGTGRPGTRGSNESALHPYSIISGNSLFDNRQVGPYPLPVPSNFRGEGWPSRGAGLSLPRRFMRRHRGAGLILGRDRAMRMPRVRCPEHGRRQSARRTASNAVEILRRRLTGEPSLDAAPAYLGALSCAAGRGTANRAAIIVDSAKTEGSRSHSRPILKKAIYLLLLRTAFGSNGQLVLR
jgi:hypothetical protein